MATETLDLLEMKAVEVAAAPQSVRRVPESLFEKGRDLMASGDFESAQAVLQYAHDADPENARVRSCLGLCVANYGRQFERAIELCHSAAKQEFFNPEHYVNLAQVYLSFGFRAEGRRYLLRARMIDPGNQEIALALRDLGSRCEPVLRFLPRGHLLNRWLGSARHVFVAPRVAA